MDSTDGVTVDVDPVEAEQPQLIPLTEEEIASLAGQIRQQGR